MEGSIDFSKDFLFVDPEINNQKYGIVTIVTPQILKGCNKNLIKFRGSYYTQEQANDKCVELSKKYSSIAEGIIEIGKWVPWSDKKDDQSDLLAELNKLMGIYLYEREASKTRHDRRKENIKENKEGIFDEEDVMEKPLKRDYKIELDNVDKSESKEIKYLENDTEIYKQKYFCISTFDPLQLEDKKYHTSPIRAFKIRGGYSTIDEAKERCEYLQSIDKHHNTYVGESGNFVEWSHNPDAEDDQYSNKDLNSLMKAQRENQEKAKAFQEQQKNDLMKESQNQIALDESSINVSEIIKDTLESNNSNNESSSNKTDDIEEEISQELENAKLLYEKMLDEQKNI